MKIVRKQTLSSFELFSFNKERPEQSLDKRDVDSRLYCHIFDNSQSQLRNARVNRGSNYKLTANKFFNFFDKLALYP